MSVPTDLVVDFQRVTGANEVIAKEFLINSNYNLERSIARYFDMGIAAPNAGEILSTLEILPTPATDPFAQKQSFADPFHFLKKNEEDVAWITGTTLLEVSFKGDCKELWLDCSVDFVFKNQKTEAIEAVFHYRSECSVYGFEVTVGDRVIRGVCEEKAEAADQYDDSISSGKSAFLLEQNKSDSSFQIILGNLAPQQVAKVTLRYCQELDMDGEANALLKVPIFAMAPPQGVRGILSVYGQDVKEVECLSGHDMVQERESKDLLNVKVSQTSLSRELSLRIMYEEQGLPFPRVEDDGDSLAVGISFIPRVLLDDSSGDETKTEVIFLIDRSGSMSGGRMKQTKNALQILIRSLHQGCFFDIVSFGTKFESMFGKSLPYTAESFKNASAKIDQFSANLGGTNIHGPLRHILSSSSSLPRQIILLTDGDVLNLQEVLELVKKEAKDTRIFALGVGMDANPELIHNVAKLAGGVGEMIMGDTRIEPIIARTMQRVLRPVIREVSMDWGTLEPLIRYKTPISHGPVYSGQKLSLYAMLFDNDHKKHKVHLTCKISSNRNAVRRYTAEIDLNSTMSGLLTHRVATMELCKEFKNGRKDISKGDCVKLCKKYSVVSSLTSLIAIDEKSMRTATTAMRKVDGNQEIMASKPTKGVFSSKPTKGVFSSKPKTGLFEAKEYLWDDGGGAGGFCSGEKWADDGSGGGAFASGEQWGNVAHYSSSAKNATGAKHWDGKKEMAKESKKYESFGNWSGGNDRTSGGFGSSRPQQQSYGGGFGSSQPQGQQQYGFASSQQQPQQQPQQYGGGFGFGSSQPQGQQQYGFASSQQQPQQQPQQHGDPFGYNGSQQGSVSSQSGFGQADFLDDLLGDLQDVDTNFNASPASSSAQPNAIFSNLNAFSSGRDDIFDLPASSYSSAPQGSSSSSSSSALRPLDKLTNLQLFDGRFMLNEELASAVNTSLNVLTKSMPQGVGKDIWATAVAIAAMQILFFHYKVEWELLAKKSRKLVPPSVLEAAVKVVSSANRRDLWK